MGRLWAAEARRHVNGLSTTSHLINVISTAFIWGWYFRGDLVCSISLAVALWWLIIQQCLWKIHNPKNTIQNAVSASLPLNFNVGAASICSISFIVFGWWPAIHSTKGTTKNIYKHTHQLTNIISAQICCRGHLVLLHQFGFNCDNQKFSSPMAIFAYKSLTNTYLTSLTVSPQTC